MRVSNSELRKFKRCRRAWWLGYYRRLRPVRDGVGAIAIGNMIHSVLEAYYATPDRDPASFVWHPILQGLVQARLEDPRLPEHLKPQMIEDAELAEIMLRGYFEWLQDDGADSELEVVSAEQELEAYLGEIEGEDVWLMAKLDVRARMRGTGRLVFVDHKSVANMTDLPKVGELDEQQRTYGLVERMHALQKTPELVEAGTVQFASGGVWNMLRKVKRTARANPPFYARAGVQHNEAVYQAFYRRVWGEVSDMIRVRRALDAGADHQAVAYPNPSRDCTWDCAFFLVCARFDDGSDVEAVIAAEYEQHDPYERYAELEKA